MACAPSSCGASRASGRPRSGVKPPWPPRRPVSAVFATRCAEAELPIALGGLCDLIEPAFGEIADELPEPQRRAIAVALGVEEAAAVVPDSLTLPRAVVAVLRLLAARTPVLLAIDDVQWLDAASGRVLAFALRRSGALPIGALVTLRGGPSVSDPLDLANAVGGDSSRRSSSVR